MLSQNSPELTRLIAEKDWSKTPLGPISSWSPALRATTEQVLAGGYGLLLWWGPEHIQIYNDAYRPVLGTKHPYGLGIPGGECWSEVWDVLGPMCERPYRTGLPSVTDDLKVFVNRYGFTEETHFTVAYSPIFDDTVEGGIGGVLAIVHETTDRVVAARRMRLLRDLGTSTAGALSVSEVTERAVRALSEDPEDVAFARIFALDQESGSANLVASFGAAASMPDITTIADIEQLAGRSLGNITSATLAEELIIVPLASAHEGMPAAMLIAGPSPLHAFDDAYFQFFDLIAAPISSGILNAIATEAERERNRVLQELDRMKNEFFSNVSHEFRTPLTLMLGPLADLMHVEDPVNRDLAEKARRNALRLLKLVNTLLEFSRLQAGRSDATFTQTDLATLTRQLVGVFGSAFESAGLTLNVDIDLKEPVFVDRSMWERTSSST